jgi:hypothetical protein
MKKILNLILVLFLFLPLISAEEMKVEMIMPDMPYPTEVFGHNHYYSVVFDEEGDAAVAAKLQIQNTGKEPLDKVVIEIPGDSVRIINALQEVRQRQKQCYRWHDVCIEDEEKYGCVKYERECQHWDWRYVNQPRFHTIDRTKEQLSKSVKFTLQLRENISEQETANIILYYKVQGYVDESLGKHNFDFETIKLGSDINNIRVAVNVQEGLYLKGGEAEIDYKQSFGAMDKMAAPAAEGVESQELQQFSNQITWARGYVKEASGLDPWESFHVKGEYAKSKASLHKLGIISGIIASMLVVVGLILAFVKLVKAKRNRPLSVALTGFLSAAGILATWFGAYYLLKVIDRVVGYRYDDVLSLLIVLLAAIIILAVLIAPAVYNGLKFGAMNGFLTLAATIVFLVVLAIAVVVIMAVLNPGQPPYRVYY